MSLIKDDVFQVVKSMTGTEKSYLKKFTSKHVIGTKNKSIVLFDLMNEQEEYDEKKILHSLNFKSQKNLSDLKSHLESLIVKSMNSYNAEHSIDRILRDWIGYIEFLQQKSLRTLALKVLHKTKKLSYKYERYPQLLELLNLQYDLLIRGEHMPNKEEDIQLILKEKKTALSHINSFEEYRILYSRISADIGGNPLLRSKAERDKLHQLIKKYLKEDTRDLAFQTKLFRSYSLAFYYMAIAKFETANTIRKSAVELCLSNPILVEENPYSIMFTLYVLAQVQYLSGKHDELLETIKRYKNLTRDYPSILKNKSLESVIIFNAYNLEQSLYFARGEYESAYSLLNVMQRDFKKFEHLMEKRMKLTFYVNSAMTYFVFEEYEKVLIWINRFLEETRFDALRSITLSVAKIVQLISHFELGNTLFLEHITRSTYRFLLSKERLFKSEKAILQFIRKNSSKNKKQITAAFPELKKELLQITKDPLEKNMLSVFDLVSYLESKITNKPQRLILKEKNKLLQNKKK